MSEKNHKIKKYTFGKQAVRVDKNLLLSLTRKLFMNFICVPEKTARKNIQNSFLETYLVTFEFEDTSNYLLKTIF